MSKSVIIIGSGIAGLSSGVYAQMNGFNSVIYEMGANPGGLCTSWKKNGFTFDGCIHWLTGITPESGYYKLWEEIGGIQGKEFYLYDYFLKYRDERGKEVTFYNDPHKLRAELLRVAPEDEKLIMRVTEDMRTLMDNELPVDFSLRTLRRTLKVIRLLYRYRMSAPGFSEKVKNERLKRIIHDHLDWHGMSIGFSFWAMSMMASKNAGYPLGGSKGFIDPIVQKYERLGGRIAYNSKVEKILVENNKAIGIRLVNGEEKRADIVLSAADGHSTIFDWLEGKYIDKKISTLYETLVPFPPLLLIYFGIRGDFSAEYPDTTFMLKTPIHIANQEVKSLSLKIYWFDPSLATLGKTVFMVMMSTDFEYWQQLKENKEAYVKEKKQVAEQVLLGLKEQYPDLDTRIEATDVATPMTFVRYTGNWKGSYQGWVLTKESMTKHIPQTLPRLENFYMAGQWISPGGGLPSGVITGRKAIKLICKKEKQKFTTIPD